MGKDEAMSLEDFVRNVAHSVEPMDFGSSQAIRIMADAIDRRDSVIRTDERERHERRIAAAIDAESDLYVQSCDPIEEAFGRGLEAALEAIAQLPREEDE